MKPHHLRDAGLDDAAGICAIYGHHVRHGTASYDMTPPTPEEIRGKIARIIGAGLPFLVAADGDSVLGYAYATQFRDRPAYRFTAENSIYVHPAWIGRGIGKRLLLALCNRAEACGFARWLR